MNVDWRETGLPSQYYEAVRDARRYALNAIGLTGTTFVLLFLGTMFWSVWPLLTAFVFAIFLLFGLIGGIGGLYETFRYVRIMPYFQRSLGEIDTFLNGKALVRSLKQLDAVAIEQGVQPLSAFGFKDDLRGETLVWYAPEEGLKTVETLLNELQRLDIPDAICNGILKDLGSWKNALQRASTENVQFCILLRHGNSTSGHEWDVRKGSAF